MAQTIATISLCIFIILIQHLYNWLIRKINNVMEEDGIALLLGLSVAVFALTFFLFKLLLEINK
jgi:presenilin-like A22 family membrane protease